MTSNSSPLLKVSSAQLVDGEGRPVLLRGFGLGGWMNMENFITGFPANEEAQREAVRKVLGPRLHEYFFGTFLDRFFGPSDADFIQSLGLNLLRLPVNYRHFENDAEPFVIREGGFKHLDRVIDLCAKRGIYTIIDLHALPGYQNQDWHSDNPTHKAFLWRHKHFQDRVVHIWEAIASRYKGNPWVAGYNPINEPADPSEAVIEPFCRRLCEAIRAFDPNHVIFLEGNRYSQDFHMFREPWPNVVYTVHDYALPGFFDGGPYPGVSRGQYVDRAVVEQTFLQRTAYMRETGTPIWVGEFGPVYRGDPLADAMRYKLLRDQLEIYDRHQASWAIWLFKDIGVQGVVYAAPDSPWMQRLKPFLEKKARLGVDAWGSVDTAIRQVIGPLEELFAAEFPRYQPFPFGARWMVNRLVRHVLLSEPLLDEFAACFEGLAESEIDKLMGSFEFERCVQREELAVILAQHAPAARAEQSRTRRLFR